MITSACPALVGRLDRAVGAGSIEHVTAAVKEALEELLAGGAVKLPDSYRRVRPDTYARRLLHRDPAGRYTAIVMTWGPGQGTPVHDHGGLWCVEGVVEGEIAVTHYDVTAVESGRFRLDARSTILAGMGQAGRLIPPTDHHVIANRHPDRAALTLHVYGGDLAECQVFVAEPDGHFTSRTRTLTFHD